jgi:copper chaperone
MQTEHLTINGMSCGGCVTRVTEALKAIPGVSGIEVAISTGKVEVTYDGRLAQPDQMKSAVERAGYSVGAAPVPVPSTSKGCCC